MVESGETPVILFEMKHKVEHFREKLEVRPMNLLYRQFLADTIARTVLYDTAAFQRHVEHKL